MKLFKSASIAALVLASAGLASGQTVIRIVGSNGDRTATQNAIAHILGASGNTWTYRGVGGKTTGTGSSGSVSSIPTGSNFGAWSGTYSGSPVVIKVSFSGALAGISAVAGNTDQRFVVTNGNDGPDATTGVTDPTLPTAVLGTDYEIGKASFGLSTNFQSTSPFNGVYQGVTYSAVNEEIVGVSPLGFYGSPGFPSGLNITNQIAQQLYTTGAVKLSLFTGDYTAGDQNKIVYALGRNTDAGQRFGAYTEIGLGTTSVVKVWKSTYSTPPTGSPLRNGVVGSHVLWPAETVNGIYSPLGSGGHTSGANLAEYLTATLTGSAITAGGLYPTATAAYYVGYVTPSDASTRVLPFGGVALKFNGVDNTTANICNGTYTAWVYNRILRPSGGVVGTTAAAFATSLANQIKTVDATNGGGILESTLNVTRSADGGPVTPK